MRTSGIGKAGRLRLSIMGNHVMPYFTLLYLSGICEGCSGGISISNKAHVMRLCYRGGEVPFNLIQRSPNLTIFFFRTRALAAPLWTLVHRASMGEISQKPKLLLCKVNPSSKALRISEEVIILVPSIGTLCCLDRGRATRQSPF